MRILLVNYRYYVSGGPERYMFHVKKLLEEHGHTVIPFSVASARNVPNEYEKYFVEPLGGQDVTYFRDVRKTPKAVADLIGRSVYSHKVEKAMIREIRDTKPDIVYILHYVNKLSPSVIRAGKKMGLPVVQRLSDYFLFCPRFDFLYQDRPCEDCRKYGLHMAVKRKCVQNSTLASMVRVEAMRIQKKMKIAQEVDCYICPSTFMRNKCVEYGIPEQKTRVIPTFTEVKDSAKTYIEGNYGLYCGRLSEEKGIMTLLKAYEKLGESYKLVLAGDDTNAGIYRQYCRDHGLRNVIFAGFCSGETLHKWIAEARYVLVPSLWYENLPNTVLEAYAANKPVIASNIGSLGEFVIDQKTGYLFVPGNSDDLADKIQRLDQSPELRQEMGISGHQLLMEKASSSAHYEALMECFQEYCKKRHAG